MGHLIPDWVSDVVSEEDPAYYEYLQDLGRRAYEEFDTEALQTLRDFAKALGLEDYASIIQDWLEISIDHWKEYVYRTEGIEIMYDERCKRWRDVKTGRFVKDPYRSLWEELGAV